MSDETNLKFPCTYQIKIIGKADVDLESIVIPIVRKHVPNLGEAAITTKDSKNSKYLSITVEFTAESKKQLDNLYIEVTSNTNVIMAL